MNASSKENFAFIDCLFVLKILRCFYFPELTYKAGRVGSMMYDELCFVSLYIYIYIYIYIYLFIYLYLYVVKQLFRIPPEYRGKLNWKSVSLILNDLVILYLKTSLCIRIHRRQLI